jgi:hypothetical protein
MPIHFVYDNFLKKKPKIVPMCTNLRNHVLHRPCQNHLLKTLRFDAGLLTADNGKC